METFMEPRTMLPRLFMLRALATGVIGLVGGLTDERWKPSDPRAGSLAAPYWRYCRCSTLADNYFAQNDDG